MQHKCGYHGNALHPELSTVSNTSYPSTTKIDTMVGAGVMAHVRIHVFALCQYHMLWPLRIQQRTSLERVGKRATEQAFSVFVFTLGQSCLDAWMIESLLLDGHIKGRRGARTTRGVCSSAPRGRGITQDTVPKVGVSSLLFKSNLCVQSGTLVCEPPISATRMLACVVVMDTLVESLT
jgi:hypothetical protein